MQFNDTSHEAISRARKKRRRNINRLILFLAHRLDPFHVVPHNDMIFDYLWIKISDNS